ncbi:MAG: hypothetical protein ACRDHL_12270 [Candidatus Promineifilaceae bacterium]
MDVPDVSAQLPIERPRERSPVRYLILGGIVALVLTIGLVVGVILLAQRYPAEIEAVRDIFIIALALESCIFGLVLLLMLVMIVRLVNMLEFEIKPILEQTSATIGTVKGTTAFVSSTVVDPVVKYTSYLAGIRRGARALFGDPRRNVPD